MTDIPTSTKISSGSRKWLLLLVSIVIALFTLVAWYYGSLAGSAIPRAEVPGGVDPGKQYFQASFPSHATDGPNKGKKITFYIPRAYVEDSGIYVDSGGSVTVPINFELPEKTPTSLSPKRPWEGMDYRSPEAEALKQKFFSTHHGSFRLTFNFGAGSAEKFIRDRVNDPEKRSSAIPRVVQLRSVAGLLRYAELTCFEQHAERGREEVLRLVAERKDNLKKIARDARSVVTEADAQDQPDDPPVPFNCVIERLKPTLFTPIGTVEDRAIYIPDCNVYDCDAYIRVDGVAIRMKIPLRLLPRWYEIVKPTQELLRSFLILPPPIAESKPAASSSNAQ